MVDDKRSLNPEIPSPEVPSPESRVPRSEVPSPEAHTERSSVEHRKQREKVFIKSSHHRNLEEVNPQNNLVNFDF